MIKPAVLLVILFALINNAPAQLMDFDFGFDIIGVYLPVEYIESLERTKHNPISWGYNRENYYHTVYIVNPYSIQASGRYDGMDSIYLWEVFNFRFENIDDGLFLIDNKNNRYRKIPGDLFEYENWSDIVANFIGTIVFDELINSGEIILENGLATFPALDNKTFRIQWQAYDPGVRRNLYLESVLYLPNNEILALEIRQNEYIFYGYRYSSGNIVWSVQPGSP